MMKKHLMFVAALCAAWSLWPAGSSAYDPWYLGWGYGNGEVGTVYSAQQNAMANTIRAQGEYNQNQAAAMSSLEDARSKYIDNHEKWTQVYYERKRMNEAQRAQDRDAALAARQRGQQFLASRPKSSTPRLSANQLDPATGHINWPAVLKTAAFDVPRKSLEELFKLRAHTSTTADLWTQVDKQVQAMKDLLRGKIRDMPSQEYMEARRFLESLAAEVRESAG